MAAQKEAITDVPGAHLAFDGKIFPLAVKANGMVFVSGTIGLDEKGEVVSGGIQEHTHQILKNWTKVLEAAGSSLDKIVKVNVFITDMDNFHSMNEAYVQYFKKPLPCRTCVAVKQLPFNTESVNRKFSESLMWTLANLRGYNSVEMECTALQ